MHKGFYFLYLTALATCSGCLTNYYDKYYVSIAENTSYKFLRGDANVELRVATTEDDVLDLMEQGYVSIGYSSFTAPYTALSMVVDTARKHSASLALTDIRYKETQKYTSVIFLPSTSTSYAYGNVSNGRTFSATTTTTTMSAVPVQRERQIYSHDVMFFKKVDPANDYGVRLFVPKRLPTEKPDEPICVRVLAVLRGSQAERDGIRRGQVVVKVNDVPIGTRKDIAPFLNGVRVVKMEVADAK